MIYNALTFTAVQLDDANSEFADSVKKLQAAIKYGEGEIQAAKSLVDQSSSGDADKHVNYGCILYKVVFCFITCLHILIFDFCRVLVPSSLKLQVGSLVQHTVQLIQ